MKALVLNGKVIQISDADFPVHESMSWVECLNNVEVGWDVVNGVVQSPPTIQPPTLSEARAKKILDLAALRYQKETSGFVFMGQTIATDDRSKTLLIGARIEAAESIANSQSFSINWKTSAGFVVLDAATIIAISDAMRAFVQFCFDVEKIHSDNIAALNTVALVDEYDLTQGWN